MSTKLPRRIHVTIEDVEVKADRDGYRPVRLQTERGPVELHYYRVPGERPARSAAVWVGGVGGGWDSPARDLYPRLCLDLAREGIASLRVRLREPTALAESVHDVLAGLTYLESLGIREFGLTGHSFGGAVVIQAAANFQDVHAVITLATQSYGTMPVALLAPRCPVLLIHGLEDSVLDPSSSHLVYRMAGEPKRIELFDGADHSLDSVAGEVYQLVRDWLTAHLALPEVGDE